MKSIIDEYGRTILYIIIGCIILVFSFALINNDFKGYVNSQMNAVDKPNPDTNLSYKDMTRPELTMNRGVKLVVGNTFDVINSANVKAKDGNGTNLINNLLIYGEVNGVRYSGSDWKEPSKKSFVTTTPGIYELRYSVQDSNGFYTQNKIKVLIEKELE